MNTTTKTETVRTFSEIATGYNKGKRVWIREWSINGKMTRWEIFAVTDR